MSRDRLSTVNSQVPQGYKQTEVGLIPEDWDFKAVGMVCDFIVPGRNKPKVFLGDIPWITTPDLEDGRGVSKSRIGLFVSRDEAKSVGSKIVPAGSVLMSCVGELGIVAFVEKDIVINQQLHAFIPSSMINSWFLLYALQVRKGYMLSVSTITAVPYLNKDNCNSIPIPIPPLPEQEAIAQALSDTDALIGSLEQLIAKKRHIKQGAMRELLTGKQRLPDFDGEWQVNKLGDVAEIIMGQSPNSSCYNIQGKGLPLIQGNADISNRKTIKRIFTTEITKKGNCGDILMSVRAPVGEISRAIFDVCLGRGVCAIRNENRNEFLYHYLIWREPNWVGLSKGSTFDSVNSADVKTFEVFMPVEAEEQNAIATILSDMDTAIAALEEKLTKTRQLKQGMMHELLTGRIRLVD